MEAGQETPDETGASPVEAGSMKEQPGKPGFWAYYLGGLVVRMSEDHLFLLAGGLAFATLITLVPLVFLVFLVLGVVLTQASLTILIDAAVEVFIPYEEEAAYLKKVLYSRIPGVVEFEKAFGVSGLAILLFSASGLFSSMRTILDSVFEVPGDEANPAARLAGRKRPETREPKAPDEGPSEARYGLLLMALPTAMGKAKDIALVLLVLCAFLLSVLSLPILAAVLHAVLSPLHSYLGHFYDLASLALIFGVFFGLYWLVPRKRPGMKELAAGAFWAALLWKLAELLFGWYLGHAASIGYLYGAYFLSVAVALWLYFASVVFIAGAAIARLRQQKRDAS